MSVVTNNRVRVGVDGRVIVLVQVSVMSAPMSLIGDGEHRLGDGSRVGGEPRARGELEARA